MWKLTLKNLRANLTRLVATAVAVIAGTAFVSTGLVLTEAIGNAVAGNVEVQYGAVDAAITPVQTGGATVAGVPADVLTEVEGPARGHGRGRRARRARHDPRRAGRSAAVPDDGPLVDHG